MRTALLLTYGSRGDHEPAIALSAALIATSKFETVHIVLQQEYINLVPDNPAIVAHPLTNEPTSKRKSVRLRGDMNDSRLLSSGLIKPVDQMKNFNYEQRCQLRDNIIPSLPVIHGIAISNHPNVIISTPKFHSIAVTIAEYLSLPVVLLQLLPTLPTSRFPHLLSSTSASVTAARWISSSRLESLSSPRKPKHQDPHASSYYRYRRWMLAPSLSRLNILRSRLHLPEIQLDGYSTPHYHFPKPFIINTYPTQIVPRIPELMACALHVPPLAADYAPVGWKAEEHCPKLIARLHERRMTAEELQEPPQRPVCVTFGPTNISRKRRRNLTRSLFQALRASGVNNIVIVNNYNDHTIKEENDRTEASKSKLRRSSRFSRTTSSMASSSLSSASSKSQTSYQFSDIIGSHWLTKRDEDLQTWAKDRVYYCEEESILFSWLFPKCRAVICHGGVGTTATALRYGVPSVIVPSIGDQFFWGHLIDSSNLGAVVTPDLLSAPQSEFEKAVAIALSSEVRLNVESIGRKVRKEGSGAQIAANVIARVVSSRG